MADYLPGYDATGRPKNPNNVPLHDADGKAYVLTAGGKKQYLTSVADARQQGSNGLITNKEFNSDTGNWDSKINWGNIIGLAAGGVAGGAGIAGLAGAGAAGAGGGASMTPLAGSAPAIGAGEIGVTSTAGLGGFVPTSAAGISAGAGGGSTSIISGLKSAYDLYNKGSQVYDSVKGITGGPSPAQAVGQTAGSIEQQRMQALIAEAKLQQEQDALGLSRANTGVNVGNLDLAQHKQALAAPGQEAGNSVRGDILANAHDATVSGLPSYIHVPQISGGLRPSLFSDSTRRLGGKMSRDALSRSMSGADTNFAPLPTVPNATPLPQSTGLDSLLQGVGGASSILGALGNLGSHGSTGGSTPQVQPGGQVYSGPGTQGYPGDSTSGTNPMIPPGPNGPIDQAAADPTPTGAGDGTMDPSILEWLKRNGQAS